MVGAAFSRQHVFELLASVLDPEVPVLNVVEMGIVRDAALDAQGSLQVTITPTYSGCPAMQVIEREILAALERAGFEKSTIKTVFAPPWTTEWMTEDARRKLREYGIAPPEHLGEQSAHQLVAISPKARKVSCPFCNSIEVSLRSEFGATACKSLYYCASCCQPFEHFKAI